MNCPHCGKEVFGKSYDVNDFYEEPKELTQEEILKKRIEELKKLLREIKENPYAAMKIPQALKG